jgi:hypothetical protein
VGSSTSNKGMSVEGATTCFEHSGGTQRNFLNTWESQITFWVRFTIFLKNNTPDEEQKETIVTRSQTLLERN